MYNDPDDAAFFGAIACVLVFLPLFVAAAVCINCACVIGDSIPKLVAMARNRTPTAKLAAGAIDRLMPTSCKVPAVQDDGIDQVISMTDAGRSQVAWDPFAADSLASKAA